MSNVPRKGFTLIEMLIVVAIIGVLASVVLLGLGPAQRRGRDAGRLSDLRQVQNGLELYFNKCGHYPGTQDCSASVSEGAKDWDDLESALTGANIGVNSIPQDPTSSQTYHYGTNDGGSSYVLGARLEDENNSALNNSPPNDIYGVSCSDADMYCIFF